MDTITPDGILDNLHRIVLNFRYFLLRQLGHEELDDHVHNVFVQAATSLPRLRDPGRLVPFVITVVRYYCYGQIDHRRRQRVVIPLDLSDHAWLKADDRTDILRDIEAAERMQSLPIVLGKISDVDREILTRFYLMSQSADEIQVAMGLSDTQFRLLKSRALTRAAEKLGHKRTVETRRFGSDGWLWRKHFNDAYQRDRYRRRKRMGFNRLKYQRQLLTEEK